MSLRIGDRVVYPTRGVAEVGEIVEHAIAGRLQRFYLLRPLDGRSSILIPVERCGEVGLRELIRHKDLPKVFKCLRGAGRAREHEPWSRRQRGFLEKIRHGDVFDLAEVFRDLSHLGAHRPLSSAEREVLRVARKLLVEELSVAGGVSSQRIDRQVDRIIAAKGARRA